MLCGRRDSYCGAVITRRAGHVAILLIVVVYIRKRPDGG